MYMKWHARGDIPTSKQSSSVSTLACNHSLVVR
jgi:hypothetical protein